MKQEGVFKAKTKKDARNKLLTKTQMENSKRSTVPPENSKRYTAPHEKIKRDEHEKVGFKHICDCKPTERNFTKQNKIIFIEDFTQEKSKAFFTEKT